MTLASLTCVLGLKTPLSIPQRGKGTFAARTFLGRALAGSTQQATSLQLGVPTSDRADLGGTVYLGPVSQATLVNTRIPLRGSDVLSPVILGRG